MRKLIYPFLLLLSGCATYHIENFQTIPPQNTSIVIAYSNGDFNNYGWEIRDAFRNAGWTVYTNDSPNAAYWFEFGMQLDPWDPAFGSTTSCLMAMDYSMSIVNKANRRPAFSMSGVSCGENIIDHLRDWLKQHPGASS